MADYAGHRDDSFAKLAGSGVNEKQSVDLTAATGGTFTLSFEGETTEAISFDAVASDIKAALEGLNSLNDVAVTGNDPFTVEFRGFKAGEDVELLTADEGNLTGNVTITEVQKGETAPVAPADRPDFDPAEFATQPGAASRALGYPRVS